MLKTLKQNLCKHQKYDIMRCEKEDNYYTCQCIKCGIYFDKTKAIGEEYLKKGVLRDYE